MKRAFNLIFILMILLSGCGCRKAVLPPFPPLSPDPDPKTETKETHPKLLFLTGEEAEIKARMAAEPVYGRIHDQILAQSDIILGQALLARKIVGGRLLSVSSEFLLRMFYLSYATRMTGDARYFKRAEKEMLNVANFSDWHPDHFLDVAEMTMGMAIGYDWLYDRLSEDTRNVIRLAIKQKGLEASRNLVGTPGHFSKRQNNWNQVCNASMAFGALAVAERYPELAQDALDRAFATLKLPMAQYEPEGLYQEGYGYWTYGTSFNALFLSAVDKYLKDDKGLFAGYAGFRQTPTFMLHSVAPSALPYNWGDNDLTTSFSPAMVWFAEKTGDRSCLASEKRILASANPFKGEGKKILPAAMIWGRKVSFKDIPDPLRTCWFGSSEGNSVAMMRSSWSDPDALYLGLKLGSPNIPHGHMDVGSFVLESDGVRWAEEAGREQYAKVEAHGNIWRYGPNAFRWKVFRLGTYSHNLVTVNDRQLISDGKAVFAKVSDNPAFSFAVSDLSSLYTGLSKMERGVAIRDGKYAVVRDELTVSDGQDASVRWSMLTSAAVQAGKDEIVLTQDGKTLCLKVKGPAGLTLKSWSADEGLEVWDSPNPGKSKVGFECTVPAGTSCSFEVLLIPGQAVASVDFPDLPLKDWN